MPSLNHTANLSFRIQPQILKKVSEVVDNNRDLYNTPSDFVRASVILNLSISELGLRNEVFAMIRNKRNSRK